MGVLFTRVFTQKGNLANLILLCILFELNKALFYVKLLIHLTIPIYTVYFNGGTLIKKTLIQ